MIALPVFAMTAASVVYRSDHGSPDEHFRRAWGQADFALEHWEPVGSVVPADARLVVSHSVYHGTVVGGEGPRAKAIDRFTDLPLTDPVTEGIVQVQEGGVPTAPDEVLISRDLARAFGVDVGDQLPLARPAATYRVAGIGRLRADFDASLMVVGSFDFASLRGVWTLTLGEVPRGLTVAEREALDGPGAALPTAWGSARPDGPRVEMIAWGWVFGALALTVLGVIVAAAFASSARRQLVTLGQLAANGATQGLMRRTLALQGAWSGIFGSVFGIGAAIVTLLATRPLVDRVIGRDIGDYVISPIDLLVILATGVAAATVAAMIPARRVTTVPVIAALAGRQPLGAVRRWLVRAGFPLFGGGVGLLLLVGIGVRPDDGRDSETVHAVLAVLGGLGVLFGLCCITPVLVGALGPVSERLSGSARLAARSLARVRMRSAAVLTAIAAAGAMSIAGGTAVASQWDVQPFDADRPPWIADNMVEISAYQVPTEAATPQISPGPNDPPLPALPPIPEHAVAGVRAVLPDAEVVVRRVAVFDPAAIPPSGVVLSNHITIGDPAVLDVFGISSADRERLATTGMLVDFEQYGATPDLYEVVGAPESRVVRIRLNAQNGPLPVEVADMLDPPDTALARQPIISEAKARELGFTVGSSHALVVSPHELTASELDRLMGLSQLGELFDPFAPVADDEVGGVVGYTINPWWPPAPETPRTLVEVAIVVGALLFTLGVVAVGLALSTAENRDEQDVLLAVGARPRSIRTVSALKAVLLAALGGIVAIPTGFLPVAAILGAAFPNGTIGFPWVVALGCAVVVPVLVGVLTWLGSVIGQRVRPVRMSTLLFE